MRVLAILIVCLGFCKALFGASDCEDALRAMVETDKKLYHALIKGDLESANNLINGNGNGKGNGNGNGHSTNKKIFEGYTPLFARLGVHFKEEGLAGNTPLMFATGLGEAKAVKRLLAAKAPVNARNRAGKTALMIAASGGELEIVKLLLEFGADIGITDEDGNSAFVIASLHDQFEIMEVLIRHDQKSN